VRSEVSLSLKRTRSEPRIRRRPCLARVRTTTVGGRSPHAFTRPFSAQDVFVPRLMSMRFSIVFLRFRVARAWTPARQILDSPLDIRFRVKQELMLRSREPPRGHPLAGSSCTRRRARVAGAPGRAAARHAVAGWRGADGTVSWVQHRFDAN
jgi:hypothetical protein